MSHTNLHAIGSEPKLKEGAETEVAKLQFQMGKWQILFKILIYEALL